MTGAISISDDLVFPKTDKSEGDKITWLNQESGFIVARITILYWSHWVLSGEEGRPQQKLNLMYLSAHNQWRHRSAKFSSSSPS